MLLHNLTNNGLKTIPADSDHDALKITATISDLTDIETDSPDIKFNFSKTDWNRFNITAQKKNQRHLATPRQKPKQRRNRQRTRRPRYSHLLRSTQNQTFQLLRQIFKQKSSQTPKKQKLFDQPGIPPQKHRHPQQQLPTPQTNRTNQRSKEKN